MAFGKNALRRFLLYSTALVLALVLLSPFILPPLINSGAVRQRIVQEIRKATGLSLSPDAIELALFPSPCIRLQDLPLDLGHGLSVQIDTLSIDLDLFELIDRRIDVDSVLIQNPSIRYNPGKSTPETAEKKATARKPSAPGLESLVLPEDFVGTLYGLLPDSQGDIVLDIANIKSDYFTDMDAKLLVFKREKKILLKTRIHGIDLDQNRIGEIAGDRLPVNRVQIPEADLVLHLDNQGTLEGKFAATGPAVTSSRLKKGPMTSPTLAFDFTLSPDRRRARLTPGKLTYPAAEVGILFDEDRRSGRTELTFKGKDVDIAQAREVCLPLLEGIEVSDQLFDILRGGTAKTVSVGFSAPSPAHLFNPENLVITGQASAARVKIPETPLIATDVGAKVTMDNGVLHIEPSRGKVPGAEIRSGVLDIDLIRHHEVPFSGTFSLDVRIKGLPRTLAALLPGTQLAEEMALVSEETGSAKAVLGLAMPPGEKELAVTVKAGEIRASGKYQRVPLPIQIDQGTFTFEKKLVSLDAVSGTLGENPVQGLTASVTMDDGHQLDLNAGPCRFAIETLMPWIKAHPPVSALLAPAEDLEGTVNLDTLSISGPMFSPTQWDFSAAGSGENIGIGFQDHPHSLEQVSGRFDISDDRIAVTGLRAKARDIRWLDFALSKESLASIRLPVNLLDGSVERTDQIFIHGKLKFPAGPVGQFDLSGTAIDRLAPTLMTLKDPGISDLLVIPYTDPSKPRYSFDGLLDTRTIKKLLIPGSSLYNALAELTGGGTLALSTDSKSDLHLETRRLNLDLLLSKEEGSQTGEKGKREGEKSRPLLAQKSLFFKAGELIYQKRFFTDVDALIRFDPDKTHVDIRRAGLCGLKGKGQVDIGYGGITPEITTFFSVLAKEDTDIDDVFSCLFNAESMINGTYAFSMSLNGQGSQETVSHRQQGSLRFEANQGRIFKATILSRVLSVINILDVDVRQQGFAYKRFLVEADIKDSVLQLKKCYIDAENMAVIADGWLDPLNDKMDVTFLVAPFKTIDSIIKAIPVINTILSGRLVSLPARASGSISHPDVVPLAPSAVGKGLINMLTDLVKTPVRLFQDEKTP